MRLKFWLLAMASPFLAACATTGHADTSQTDSPLHGFAVWAGIATNPDQAADFVQASRPQGKLDYMPVGVTPASSKDKAKKLTPLELKALEDELEATRLKNAEAAGVTP